MTAVTNSHPTISDSIRFSLVQQGILLTLGAGILDGGQVFQVLAYAALAYWGGFALIMLRRRHHLTFADRILIRWGYMVLWIMSAVITGFIWHLRGYEL
jgi:hypothetical protein